MLDLVIESRRRIWAAGSRSVGCSPSPAAAWSVRSTSLITWGRRTSDPGRESTFGPDPHIGLSTVTYLFDGEIRHRDSLGSDQAIRPGEVNWKTTGGPAE